MTEQIAELKQRLVVGHKQDGRCCYDPQAKRELIEASMQPGVSVAKLALAHGINANLLRTWIGKQQRQSLAANSSRGSAATPSPFVPVVPIKAQRSPITAPGLAVRLPNGVRLEWSVLPGDQLAHVLRLLSALPCSESIPG
ncbi:transposase [Comamonas aquatica]|uniref:IS66 family insertion sequence element accessory protein TnpA n=1 Tax=Comamonas aquatica TaxID=225991 RepID=UPI00244B3F26|nr:transposase [Comamonas aquatica]MDH1381239.1 transposase [Comamonas aquatica]MDH1641229.1 transposase [Comamonas aquatica]